MTVTAAAFEIEYAQARVSPKPASNAEGLATVQERIDVSECWLVDQGVDVKRDHQYMDPHSKERLYWHYGYLMGMKYALEVARTGHFVNGADS
jgi:hypothetical protein